MRALQGRIGNARPDAVMELILEPLDGLGHRAVRAGSHSSSATSGRSSRATRSPAGLDSNERFRREKELPKGELMGESVDLYTLIRAMRFPYEIEEGLDPLLVEYELSLDSALSVRAAKIASLQEEIKDAMAGMDFDGGLRATDQIMSDEGASFDVSRTITSRRSPTALPAELGEQFRRAALLEGYPRAFRPTPIPRLIESDP